MRIRKNIFLGLLFASFLSPAYSQILREGEPVPQGAIIYSLPQTSVRVTVTAEFVNFVAGPYASYASKFMGENAQTSNSQTYNIKEIKIEQLIEADPEFYVAANIGTSKNASANFLNFSSQGLIVAPGFFSGSNSNFIFKHSDKKQMREQISPTSVKENRIYKTIVNEDGEEEKIATMETQVIERDLEKRAEETAQIIFKLREKKIDILVGDTDANYNGEALGAAVKEMTKLENQYSSLFFGTKKKSVQTSSFDIVPSVSNSEQRYEAFRISENQGLLPIGSGKGRVIYLVLSPEGEINPIQQGDISSSKGKIVYRTPVAVRAKIVDGEKILAETRLLIYQFGKILTFPLELASSR